MPNTNYPYSQAANNYDPRWFIWTIVFLVVTGISLVSYIVLSDSGTDDITDITPVKTQMHKSTAQNK